jgi:outer membrane protein OmpA-like peptidoglycan-associated protein
MRLSIAAFLVSLGLAAATPVCAQTVDTGREFQVNPVSGAGTILLYPGGQYSRTVTVLRQPGDNGAPIRLHMPAKGARKAAATEASAAPSAPRPAPAPKVRVAAPKPKPKVVASTAPARPAPAETPSRAAPTSAGGAAGAAAIFGGIPSNPFGAATSPAPAPAPPKTQVASAAPSAPPSAAPGGEPSAGIEGLTNHKVILFAANAEEPADSARDAIRFLAGDLTNAMTRPQSRVWLMGHGGPKGDKGSEARRISLKRALSIRQLLIDAGLSMDRISVQAQGGVDDSGPADRVDVYVKE